MNRRSQAVGVLVATAVAVVSTLVVAPSANAWEPPGGGVFNYPQGGHAAAWRIVDTVDAAIKHAPKGSRIMVSSFLMDANRSADALIAARRRGVAVQLVLDGNDGRTGQTRRIARVVNRDNKPRQKGVNKDGVPLKWGRDESFVVFCKGTCRGGGDGNNHTKFYLFTKTGSARNVVMVSSSNLNAGGAVRGWNDMYVMKDRLALLRQYASIHAQMAQDRSFGTKNYRQVQAGNITARFFPRPHGGDPVLSDLRQVRCHGATGGAGRGGRTAINISMFAWNSTRGMAIARRLVQLQSHGCYVSIVYGAPSAQVRDYLAASARRGGVKLWDSRVDRDEDGLFDLRVHHKYMLINGVYGGDRSSWRVHAGSQNWGRGTLRHGDENTINIVSRKAYTQYIRNWDSVVKVSRRIGGPREAEIAATQPALRSLIR
jgi:phosphatidylserine/phosphatidylglycerophosphate/cardiolipin synthase-like enzyme